MKLRMIIGILMIGFLSACGGQMIDTPASTPTEEIVPATQTSTNTPQPTDTVTPVPPTETPTSVSFTNDILPILQDHCINCHGGQKIEEGLIMRSRAELMAGSNNGPVILPGDAANSLLVEMIASQKMPKKGPKLTQAQIQLIVDWINQGAPEGPVSEIPPPPGFIIFKKKE